MNRNNCFLDNCSQIIPIAIIGGTFSFFIISTINYQSVHWYPWLVSSRIMLGVIAALLILWLTFKPAKWPWIDSIYITLGLAVQASHGILEPVNSIDFYQYTALFFIAAALSYKGSFRTWLTTFLPVQAMCILLPLCVKESTLHNTLPVIIDIYSMPIAGLLIGSAMARLSATKYEALEKNINLQQKLIEEYYEKQGRYEALGNLANQVAHDIRSPLSSLKAASKMLKGHVAGNSEAMEIVNLLQLSASRLENIANDLLTQHYGKTAVCPVLLSIHEVLDELIGEFQASPLGINTEFKKYYSSGAQYVSGDKTGMTRAIGNIIKNALEAMQGDPSDRRRQLTVATLCQNDNVVIRITDSGPGIPVDKIPLILQGGHTEGKLDGHGIGTKVVKEIVDAHKGYVSIESQVGVGTTFIITLPAAVQNDETIVTIPHAGNGVICVIDDEPSLCEQWRLTFYSMGITAKVFTCWEDFDAAKEGIALEDTFVVDYHFDNSVVDGLEVIRRLKDRGFTNLVLATAEYWKPAIKDAAKNLGIVLCPKPLPKVVLSQPVQQQQPSQCHPDTTGPSILLIDDDSSIHFSWKMMRKSLGVGNLTMHSNLEEMIAAATNPAKFDLCVIDKNIEGSQFDGAHTLEYLRQNGAKTIVLASGETGDDIRKDPRFSSADGVLRSKVPMTPEELDPFLN